MDTWPIASVTDDDVDWVSEEKLFMGPEAADTINEALTTILDDVEAGELSRSDLLRAACKAGPDTIQPIGEQSPLAYEAARDHAGSQYEVAVAPLREALETLAGLYRDELGRPPYDAEVLAALDFVIAPLIDDGTIAAK